MRACVCTDYLINKCHFLSVSVCVYLSVCNTNHAKTTGPIATKLGTWTKSDLMVNVANLVSSVLVGVREGRSTKIIDVNV